MLSGGLNLKGLPEERAVMLAEYIIENNATVRCAAKAFGISKSTVHKDLAKRLKGSLAHVNLIPVNSVTETGYKKSDANTVKDFCEILEKNGIAATVRRKLGSDINASCGQLRRGEQKS